MKKLFYSLSAALILGLTANAATPQMSQMQLNNNAPAKMQITKVQGLSLKAEKNDSNKPKRVGRQAQAEDFLGTWDWTSFSYLGDNAPSPMGGTLSITQDEKNPNMLILRGLLPSGLSLNGYVQDGKLIVPNAKLFDDDGDEAWFWNFYLQSTKNPGEYNFVKADDAYQFYFSLTDEGGLWAGDPILMTEELDNFTDEQLKSMACMLAVIPIKAYGPADEQQFFYMLNAWVQAKVLNLFTFSEDEWTYIGESEFKDAWFKGFWDAQGYEPAPFYVPTYVRNDNSNVFLLYDPYGPDTPYLNVNTDLNRPGYLIFSVTNPDCVVFQPLVYSITISDIVVGGDGETTLPFFNYNLEGYYNIIEGVDTDEIAMAFDNMGIACSNFDPNDGFVDIQNAVFAIEGLMSLQDYSTWDTPLFDMSGYILLPEGWDSGVEGIVGDNENAPVEYYNLMGVKVNNPAKGQLVIVRKGNKAYKTFAK